MDGTETQDEENILNSHAKIELKIVIISYFPMHVNEIISPLADGNS